MSQFGKVRNNNLKVAHLGSHNLPQSLQNSGAYVETWEAILLQDQLLLISPEKSNNCSFS